MNAATADATTSAGNKTWIWKNGSGK